MITMNNAGILILGPYPHTMCYELTAVLINGSFHV